MNRKIGVIFLLILGLVGCAVVNVYVTFPEEKVKKAAEDLLAPPPSKTPQSFLDIFFTKNLYADEVIITKDLKTDSPKIKEAKEKMDSWREILDQFKKDGYIGETNDFKVVIKEIPKSSEIEKKVRKIVDDENKQREIMIKELLKINNAAPEEEKKFRKVFSEVAQKYSPVNTWIQLSDGFWTKKK
ncbi:MAG: YdbL family protein [Candidatus Omnitrophica bacterium]|nr:YdbL family protein [Candidatus Omnitrophota bacterium]MCM8801912.1 YdbL family protein [Candidatus Omnitrophota bacterium]